MKGIEGSLSIHFYTNITWPGAQLGIFRAGTNPQKGDTKEF